MVQPRVLLGFATASDHEIEELGGAVLTGLYGNPHFSHPNVSLAALTVAHEHFTAAIAAQTMGGLQAAANKDTARAALIGLLRLNALYVQQTMLSNPAYGLDELLSTGFDAVSSRRAPHPFALDIPAILTIDNSGEGQLILRVAPVANAHQYEVQYQPDGAAAWQSGGLYNNTRGMAVYALTPGEMYVFRVRAFGGSSGQSGWSKAVSHRSG